MTTADRRLDAVTTGLTARERAILTIGIWNRSEEPEDRLIKYMPPEQKEEFERLVKAVENANDEFWSDCSLWCEWIQQADIELAWLESISAVFARQAKLVAALKAQGVAVREEAKAARRSSQQALILPPMPTPGRGFHRDIPRLLGVALHEEDPPPENWEGAIRSLSDSVREAVEVRWQDLAATEIALEELAEVFGADCCHPKLREVLDAVRRKLLDHYEAALLFATPFRLPEPAERYLENARGRVDWEAFKSKEEQATSHQQQSQRAWLSQEQRAALEEIEARWKDAARSLKPSPARDITRDVPVLPAGRRRRKPAKAAGRT
jgi:hypothetical protein